MEAPRLEHVCDLTVHLAAPIEMGEGRGGKRRIIPIIGGEVKGGKIAGKILNLGADWQTVYSDGLAYLDTRYAIETHDGATIEIINTGYRHGPADVIAAIGRGEDVPHDQYYMRTHARLESGDPRYAWVNNMLFVGTGERKDSSVKLALYMLA